MNITEAMTIDELLSLHDRLYEIGTMRTEAIKVHYIEHRDGFVTPMKQNDMGDWIDLRCAEPIDLTAGSSTLVPLGLAMKLPPYYEAHVIPRSSLFKNWGLIQTNSMGLIDNTYCGNNDEWKLPVYAIRDTYVPYDTRICQFRIVSKQPYLLFKEVDHLDSPDRGGFGSTGNN